MKVADYSQTARTKGVQVREHEIFDTSAWQRERASTAVLKRSPAVNVAPRHVIDSSFRSVRWLSLNGVCLIGTPYLAPVRTSGFVAFVAQLHVHHKDVAVRRGMSAHEPHNSAIVRAGAGEDVGQLRGQ